MLSSAFLLLEVLEALELEVLLLPTVLELLPEATAPDPLAVEVLEDTDQDLLVVGVLVLEALVSEALVLAEDLPLILTSMLEVLEALAVLVLEAVEVLEVPVLEAVAALELVDSCSTES